STAPTSTCPWPSSTAASRGCGGSSRPTRRFRPAPPGERPTDNAWPSGGPFLAPAASPRGDCSWGSIHFSDPNYLAHLLPTPRSRSALQASGEGNVMNCHLRIGHKGQRGFTLIELLIVV